MSMSMSMSYDMPSTSGASTTPAADTASPENYESKEYKFNGRTVRVFSKADLASMQRNRLAKLYKNQQSNPDIALDNFRKNLKKETIVNRLVTAYSAFVQTVKAAEQRNAITIEEQSDQGPLAIEPAPVDEEQSRAVVPFNPNRIFVPNDLDRALVPYQTRALAIAGSSSAGDDETAVVPYAPEEHAVERIVQEATEELHELPVAIADRRVTVRTRPIRLTPALTAPQGSTTSTADATPALTAPQRRLPIEGGATSSAAPAPTMSREAIARPATPVVAAGDEITTTTTVAVPGPSRKRKIVETVTSLPGNAVAMVDNVMDRGLDNIGVSNPTARKILKTGGKVIGTAFVGKPALEAYALYKVAEGGKGLLNRGLSLVNKMRRVETPSEEKGSTS